MITLSIFDRRGCRATKLELLVEACVASIGEIEAGICSLSVSLVDAVFIAAAASPSFIAVAAASPSLIAAATSPQLIAADAASLSITSLQQTAEDSLFSRDRHGKADCISGF